MAADGLYWRHRLPSWVTITAGSRGRPSAPVPARPVVGGPVTPPLLIENRPHRAAEPRQLLRHFAVAERPICMLSDERGRCRLPGWMTPETCSLRSAPPSSALVPVPRPPSPVPGSRSPAPCCSPAVGDTRVSIGGVIIARRPPRMSYGADGDGGRRSGDAEM